VVRAIQNLLLLFQLLLTNPVEFLDRAALIADARKEKLFPCRSPNSSYPKRSSLSSAVEGLSTMLDQELTAYQREPELQTVKAHVSELTAALNSRLSLPFPTIFNADWTLACLAYVLCRALQPTYILETGVGYGVTSAMMLAALHKNGRGILHSIDLPPVREKASDPLVGIMVPDNYRYRWTLHVGTSSRVLPALFSGGLADVGLFIHDSSNLRRIQRMELNLIWPHLASSAAIVVNNVGRNPAFAEFVKDKRINSWFTVDQQEKKGDLTGVAVKRAWAA
jgi:hypothetical protein